uniref:Uncharacterized protein n=1 Tax=Mesocestoides corti TaxID=53468 RepID=A0A5K3EUN8_MESCO
MVPPPPRFYTDRRRSRSPLGVSSHSGRGERNLPPRHFKNGQPYSEYRPKVRVDGNINNIRREFGLPRYDVPRHGRVFEQSSAPWAQSVLNATLHRHDSQHAVGQCAHLIGKIETPMVCVLRLISEDSSKNVHAGEL